MKTFFCLIFSIVALMNSGTLNAAKVQIDASEDSYVLSTTPTTSYGSASTLLVKHDVSPSEVLARAFIKFDLSSIPADATIQAALLCLYDQTAAGGNRLPVYAVSSGWSEIDINWDNQPSFDPAEIGTLPGFAGAQWFSVDVTSVVEEWRGGTRSNHGLLVKEGSGYCLAASPEPFGPRTFRSSEYFGFKPYLMVIYGAETLEITSVADAHVKSATPDVNYGSSEALQVINTGCWSYLRFDTGSLPLGTSIEYARIRLYQYSFGGLVGGSFPISAHNVNSSWTEGAITWTTKPAFNTVPESFCFGIAGSSHVGWVDLDVTESLQGWLAGGDNYGIVVKNPFEITFSMPQAGNFRSREYAGTEYRPQIEVFYSSEPENQFIPSQSLTGVYMGDDCWGDIDGDGDLDLIVCGDTGFGAVTSIYFNFSGTLTESFSSSIPDILCSASSDNIDLGDYDNDGDLDLAIAGEASAVPITGIYKNNGSGTFTLDTRQSLTQLKNTSLAWGDYDGDGDLDLYVQGYTGSVVNSTLYRNDGTGLLSPATTSLTGLFAGSADWIDFDGDGDLDLAVTGSTTLARMTIFYENIGGTLTSLGDKGLPGLAYSDMAWGDYDNDGDMDLALTGESYNPNIEYARVYNNDGGGGLTLAWQTSGLRMSSCAWGDFTNDGKLDLAFCGDDAIVGQQTYLFYNDGTNDFARLTQPAVADVYRGTVSWADVDNDADLDLFLTGDPTYSGTPIAILYDNTSGPANTPPSPPNLFGTVRKSGFTPFTADTLIMRWDGAQDAETSERGLYYCVRVGTERWGEDIFSGTYGSPLMGNVQASNELRVTIPPSGPDNHFYWSVKAVDAGLMASGWSVQQCSWDPDSLWSYDDDPVDDAFVDNALPNTPLGSTQELNLIVGDAWNSGNIARTYIKFNPPISPEPGAEISRAELHVYCRSVISPVSYYISAWDESDDFWDESTITWNNAPTWLYYYPRDVIRVTPGWNVWDVTKSLTAMVDNEVTFVLRGSTPLEGTSGVWAEFDSKEFENAPFLRIHYVSLVGDDENGATPGCVELSQNIPNPFNPATRISFTIPGRSENEHVTLRIYDVAGRLMRTLLDESRSAGLHTVIWDGKDRNGSPVASGIYFYRLQWNGKTRSRKMVLLR
ncbi:MAG: DNRLRE domain-containing protein [Candidatus Krumholzibacteriota bacterium]|nr:DNRLRE domain-containing protein [Candidatus Krumholzibacteriota bacterium]